MADLVQDLWNKYSECRALPENSKGTDLTFVPFHVFLLELTSQLVFVDKGTVTSINRLQSLWIGFIHSFIHLSTYILIQLTSIP